MIKKSTLILLLVFIVLVAVFFILYKQDTLDFMTKKDEPTETPNPGFVSFDSDLIKSINFIARGEEPIVISRLDGQQWQINVEGGIISAGAVEQLISEFNATEVTTVLSMDLEGSAYGLIDPAYTFTINSSNGKQISIKIGSSNPIQTGYYAQVDIDPIVIISQGSVENIITIIKAAQIPPTPTITP